MERKKAFFIKFMASFLMMTMVMSMWTNPISSGALGSSNNVKAPISLAKETEKNQLLKGEEFTIHYKIEPRPIPAEQILPDSYLMDKEVVLVIDTSGSMKEKISGSQSNNSGKQRINVAQEAANLFISKFEDKNKKSSTKSQEIYVSLVSYDNIATTIPYHKSESLFFQLSDKNHYNKLNSEINKLSPDGGTNIGDGLRHAYHNLKNSQKKNTRKYVILMTDGQPTAFSYEAIDSIRPSFLEELFGNYAGQKIENGSDTKVKDIRSKTFMFGTGPATKYFVNNGDGDLKGLSKEYAQEMSKRIGSDPDKIGSFFIGFGEDSNKSKLKEIAAGAGGFYKEAKTADDILEVYEKLAEQIQSDLPIHGINFKEIFPLGMKVVNVSKGIEFNGQTVTGDIGSIPYTLNHETKQFEAAPFAFSITLKAEKTGEYLLGQGNSDLTYQDIDGSNSQKSFPAIKVNVYEKQPPQIEAKLRNHPTNEERYQLDLTIDEPAKIEVYNQAGKLLWRKDETLTNTEYPEPKSFTMDLNKGDINGHYLTIQAWDKFQNKVDETIPIVSLGSLELKPWSVDDEKREGILPIETENNSIIETIKLNGITVSENKLTDEGKFIYTTKFNQKQNEIEITVKNQYGNKATQKFEVIVDLSRVSGVKIERNKISAIRNGRVDVKFSFELTGDFSMPEQEFILSTSENGNPMISRMGNEVVVKKIDGTESFKGIISPMQQDGSFSIRITKNPADGKPLPTGKYQVEFVVYTSGKLKVNQFFELRFLSPAVSDEDGKLEVTIVEQPKII